MVEPIHVIIIGLIVAAVGVGWQFYRERSSMPPPPSDDGAIEWDSGQPKLVFDTYVNGGIWIREFKISGRNRLDRPFKDCDARITPDMTGKEILLKISIDEKGLPADKEAVIPPRASFRFFYTPPSSIKAPNFLREFGAMRFHGSCTVGTGGGSFNFDKFFAYAELEQQIQDLIASVEKELAASPARPKSAKPFYAPDERADLLKALGSIIDMLRKSAAPASDKATNIISQRWENLAKSDPQQLIAILTEIRETVGKCSKELYQGVFQQFPRYREELYSVAADSKAELAEMKGASDNFIESVRGLFLNVADSNVDQAIRLRLLRAEHDKYYKSAVALTEWIANSINNVERRMKEIREMPN